MSDSQKRYALKLIGSERYSSVEIRTMLLLAFTGITIDRRTANSWACSCRLDNGKRHRFLLKTWQVHSMTKQLKYVDSYDDQGVRLESIRGFKAVDVHLHNVRFKAYLNMEKYYQAYLVTKKPEMIIKLARLLYASKELTELDVAEQLSTFLWYSYVKKYLAGLFPHFFRPMPPSAGRNVNWIEQMNAQIRALTEGDITKEETILNMDCWRALTELDEKAREAEDFRKKYPNS